MPKGKSWESRSCISALPLAEPARALVVAYKDKGERRLAPVIAAIMATALDEAASWQAPDGFARFDAAALDAICFVPATGAAYRRRGFDHMEAVAQNLALLQGLPLADVLVRPFGKDQRRLGKDARAANTRASVMALGGCEGCSFLLVDDVITTGSSMRASMRALFERGAKSVVACSFARAW